jgi:hypothetical protein
MVLGWPGLKGRPCLQNNQSKSAEGVAQAVQHLSDKYGGLSSNPSIPKKITSLSYIKITYVFVLTFGFTVLLFCLLFVYLCHTL